MNQLATYFSIDYLKNAKDKVDAKVDELKPNYDEAALSNLLFRTPLDKTNDNSTHAHLQAINTHLNKFFREDEDPRLVKRECLCLELSKSITLFDHLTNLLGIDGGMYGDNFIASQNFYLDAISSYKNYVPSFYQGDINFSCIPLKLRLAIEVYFKNIIGYEYSKQEILTGKRKGKTLDYPLSISDLLRFFSDKKYKKYVKLPINIEIVKDINYWSNNLMHTGVISFAWQNLTAIELLHPLFYTKHENGSLSIDGFNYLDLNQDQQALAKDLNIFLSDNHKKVDVQLFKHGKKPREGMFYY
jgi:hypothetical protein